MFEHKFLDKLVIEQVNSPYGRKYKTLEGNEYKSVTTWLNQLHPHKFDDWKNSVGHEEASKIAKRASDRGTILHSNIEKYLLNEDVSFVSYDYLNKSLFNSIKPLLSRINNIRLLESPLYSHLLRLAGTVDCVADWDGVLSVIDFKSSTNIKDKESIESYWLQTTIYALMVEERYGIKINQLVILVGNEYSAPSLFVDSKKNWLHILVKYFKENPP